MSRARIALLAALLLLPSAAGAQRSPRPRAELRADVVTGDPAAGQAGVGISWPLGVYARLTTVVAGGASRDSGAARPSARGDVLVRFLLDPFGESRVGLSAGGGLSVRWDERRGWRPFVALAVDLEGRSRNAPMPFVQVGLGGGLRAGLGVRWRGGAYR